MSGSTEDRILSSIPDFQDGGSDDQPSGTEAQSTETAEGTSALPTDSTTGRVDEAGGTGSGANTTGQQRIVRRHDGLVEVPNTENPATRDLVDPVTGRVVAKGGIERRVFEEGARHARENTQLKQQLQAATVQLQATNETARVARDLGVEPENQVAAIRVMADFMKDPVRTLEYLVAEVKAKGYQIPFLQTGVTPGMDMQAIGRMIDSKMHPITEQQRIAQQQQEANTQARRTLDSFLTTHPEAEANLATLAEMITAQPGMGLADAYVKLVGWATENGLDYRQPLPPQIAARTNGSQTQQQPTQPQGQPRPLPQGRSAASGAAPVGQAAQFNENASWSDIIRDSMREAGLQLR